MKEIDTKVIDYSFEHSQHTNMVKGISGRTCPECYKEHKAILESPLNLSNIEPYKGYSHAHDFNVLNSDNGRL